MSKGDVVIRTLTPSDIADVADLHYRVLPSLNQALGRQNLAQLYKACLSHPDTQVLVAGSHSVIGFAVFTADLQSLNKHCQQIIDWRFLMRLTWLFMTRPLFTYRSLADIVASGKSALIGTKGHLATIGVDLAHQANGIGRALIQAGETSLLKHGVTTFTVETDLSNTTARNFYLSNRFNIIGQSKKALFLRKDLKD